MATESPWEVIRAAADRLEELAKGACKGPWFAPDEDSTEDPDRIWAENGYDGGYTVVEVRDFDDALWITALSPAVAEPLVAWLHAVADRWAAWPWPGVMPKPDVDSEAALAFARKITGGDHE